MSRWTRRERGLGIAVVLMAVGAIAVPAWGSDDESNSATVQVASDSAGDGGVVMLPGRGELQGLPPLPSAEERKKIDDCMAEHGYGPGSQAAEAVPVPEDSGDAADRGEGQAFEAPEPDPAFKKAAEECGLPAPPDGIAVAVAGGDGDQLCPPLPPAPLGEDQSGNGN